MIDTLQAIAEPNRLSILQLMRNAELSAGEVAGHFKEISRPAVSQHLRVLKKAGLIAERRQGKISGIPGWKNLKPPLKKKKGRKGKNHD